MKAIRFAGFILAGLAIGLFCGYLLGFRSGCKKVLGNSENIGAAMDRFCYGDMDLHRRSLEEQGAAERPASSPKTKEYCGKREGTAGNAFLLDKTGREVITLAIQGDSQALLEQADSLVGENSGIRGNTGTQNGISYCLVAEVNDEGEPMRIIEAKLAQ